MHHPTHTDTVGPRFTDLATGVTMHPREFPLGAGLIAIPARMVAATTRERLRDAARDIS